MRNMIRRLYATVCQDGKINQHFFIARKQTKQDTDNMALADDIPRSPLGVNAALLNLPHLTEKDPLMVTPEKPTPLKKKLAPEDENTAPKLSAGLLTAIDTKNDLKPPKNELEPEKVHLIPTTLTSLVDDPTLDVTPEKPLTVLKKPQKDQSINSRNLHVRFNVPSDFSRGSEESQESDFVPLERLPENHANVGQKEHLPEPFERRAALYVHRNPLADITSDSSLPETSENTTSSETITSNDSQGSLFNKIAQFIEDNERKVADMSGKVIRGDENTTVLLPEVKLKATQKVEKTVRKAPVKQIKSKIINVNPDRSMTNSVIDQVTRPKTKQAEVVKEKMPFLKKKSGLQRHEHSVRYAPVTPPDENPLGGPTYNSTLCLGQDLQELKISEFNAKEAVTKKMEESERLRNYIAEKTAEATNINPDEKLYQNLVSVEVPEEDDLVPVGSAKWKRTKLKPYHPKKSKFGEPDIWETYDPAELYYTDLMLDFETIEPPKLELEPVPIEEVMWMDGHEQLWSGAWGWNL